MADQQLTEANVRLCFEKIKDLINSLPQETFEEDTDLADKKKMADEAEDKIEEAQAILENAVLLNPQSIEAHFQLGRVYYNNDDN